MDRVTLGNIYSVYKMFHLECKMQDDSQLIKGSHLDWIAQSLIWIEIQCVVMKLK